MHLPDVNPNDGQTAHSLAVNHALYAHQIAQSSDYLINRDKFGTTITLKPTSNVEDIPFMPVTWSRAAGAGIGDVVVIIPSGDQPTGSMSGSASGSSFPTTWVCECNVPDSVMSDYIVANPGLFTSGSTTTHYIRQTGVNYEPQNPEPATLATLDNPIGRYWRAIGGGGSGGGTTIERFKITDGLSIKHDWFSASKWNPSINDYDTATTIVSKPFYNRPSYISDNIYGAPISYVYIDNSFRTATIASNSQTEQLFRPYQTGDFIVAQQLASAESLPTASNIMWREVNERVWAKVN